MPVKVGGAGQLYGSVSAADIAESVSNALNLDIDRRAINLSSPIRDQGHHNVRIRFAPDVYGELTVTVFDDSIDPAPGLDFVFNEEEQEEEPTFEGAIAEIEAEENAAIDDEGNAEDLDTQTDEDESTDANLDQESDAEANDTDEEEVVEN